MSLSSETRALEKLNKEYDEKAGAAKGKRGEATDLRDKAEDLRKQAAGLDVKAAKAAREAERLDKDVAKVEKARVVVRRNVEREQRKLGGKNS